MVRAHVPMSVAQIWLYLLVGGMLLGVGLLGWSIYLFLGISEETLFTPVGEQEGVVLTIDRSELREVLDFIELRRVRFEELRQTAPTLLEPR